MVFFSCPAFSYRRVWLVEKNTWKCKHIHIGCIPSFAGLSMPRIHVKVQTHKSLTNWLSSWIILKYTLLNDKKKNQRKRTKQLSSWSRCIPINLARVDRTRGQDLNPECWCSFPSGAQGFPTVADEHAQCHVPRVHSAKRLQDDGGAAQGHQSQPPAVLRHFYWRLPQLAHGQGKGGKQSPLVLNSQN